MNFRLGELFCGPGGLGLGAKLAQVQAGSTQYAITHAWASDYDADSCHTYAHNLMGQATAETVICADVHQLDIAQLPPIDAFAYGFPCNDFSIVGEQKGFDGHFGGLYEYGVAVINQFSPKFFVAENVSGLSSANEGQAFRHILDALANAGDGYDLTVHLYRAEEYGVPQTRHRIIIVGVQKALHLDYKVPAPTTAEAPPPAGKALEHPPIPAWAANQEPTRQSEVVVERLKYIQPGQNAWTAELPPHLQLNVKGAKLSQIYRRLDPAKPSYTITGSGGGGTHGYHWHEPRALTNRERARLQTFPDEYQFMGSKESVRKQIGMAVPPKLAQVVFESILKTFAGIPYRSVKPNFEYAPQTQQLALFGD